MIFEVKIAYLIDIDLTDWLKKLSY